MRGFQGFFGSVYLQPSPFLLSPTPNQKKRQRNIRCDSETGTESVGDARVSEGWPALQELPGWWGPLDRHIRRGEGSPWRVEDWRWQEGRLEWAHVMTFADPGDFRLRGPLPQ